MTVESEVNPNEAPKKKRGRPKKVREPVREPMRAPIHEEDIGFAYSPEDADNQLHIPPELIPDGMTYLWVTCSVYGQPQPQRLARFQKQGWVPVPATRYDGMFMPKGHQGVIEIDGLMLHERSKKITDMARAYERQKARGQIRTKEAQLLGGGMDGVSLDTQHPSALRSNTIKKSYEPVPIPGRLIVALLDFSRYSVIYLFDRPV